MYDKYSELINMPAGPDGRISLNRAVATSAATRVALAALITAYYNLLVISDPPVSDQTKSIQHTRIAAS